MNAFQKIFRFQARSARPGRFAIALAFALAAATAWASSVPVSGLDGCKGGEGLIHVWGWACDPDEPTQSLDVKVYLYTDSGCIVQYGDVRVLKANVSRPDVNESQRITGDHGFDGEIPVPNTGTYWVKLFAIDATGEGDSQVGETKSVFVHTKNDCTVKVTKFHQSYPYSGKATVEYTVDGTFHENSFATITINTDDASATFIQTNVVAGKNKTVIDFAESFGGAMLLTNATFTVTISVEKPGGVQLWENGPYWAQWNVGATAPWQYGYYFWWGDVVGYTISGEMLPNPDPDVYRQTREYRNVTWESSAGEQMGSSPFSSNACPTYDKYNEKLLSEGYIDSSGKLAAGHDAATAHLGPPWRMPTPAEVISLFNNCTVKKAVTGPTYVLVRLIDGYLFTGKGDYADRSIFIPRAGYACGSDILHPGDALRYWSSSPDSFHVGDALATGDMNHPVDELGQPRYYGMTIRPVRDCDP